MRNTIPCHLCIIQPDMIMRTMKRVNSTARMIIDSNICSSFRPWYGSKPFPRLMYSIQGRPSPTMILNVLEPNAFETAWFPNPFSAATFDAT